MLIRKIVLGLAMLAVGCGAGVEGRYPVRGLITYNGEPIRSGSVVFVPIDPEGRESIKTGGPIVNGMYELEAKLGPRRGAYRVEVLWMRPTGKKLIFDDPPVEVDEIRNVLPTKYNTETELSAEVKSVENVFNFELTGPPLSAVKDR